jgi:hypothetical protein
MSFRRRKSRAAQVADLAADYLKLRAARKATKGAAKGAKKAAKGTAVYQVAKKTPVARAVPVVAGAGVLAAVVAVRKLRGGDESPQPA